MKATVIYDSQFGNTERIARAIAERLGGAELLRADAVDMIEVTECGLLVVGGPTQGHGASSALKTLLAAIPRGALQDLPAAAFDTRLRMSRLLSGSAAQRIARELKRTGARLVVPPESFLVTGREGPLADGEVERARAWAAMLAPLIEAEPEPIGPSVAAP
jgi:flavodoxin